MAAATERDQDLAWVEEAVRHLASFERESASPGERRAAEWIAERLAEEGCDARVEEERAVGGYWWSIGSLNAAAALAALWLGRRPGSWLRRAVAAAVGTLGATAIWDEVGHGSRWFRQAVMRYRPTYNTVAWAGDPDAERTVVFIAHHDAAHTGLIFHPRPGWWFAETFPRALERSTQTLPVLYGVWLGPVLVALGAALGRRRLRETGRDFSIGATVAMADIGRSPVVPGANDNLASVGVLLALARWLREHPVAGLRVLLLSTGSEESFSEGMQAFGRRHFAELPRESTEIVCLECVGSPHPVVLRGEGMLRMRDYPQEARDALTAAAREVGVEVDTTLRTVGATDAIIALRAGYRVGTLAACDDRKLPANYHWPSDVPDNLDWGTIGDIVAICQAFLRARSGRH